MSETAGQPPGWYYAQGDPPGTQRYWDGFSWQGGPQPVAGGGSFGMSELADGGSRIGAWIVDGFTLVIPLVIVSLVIVGGSEQNAFGTNGRQIISGVVTTLLWFAYHVVLNSNGGQTLGRKLAKIRIVKLDDSVAGTDTMLKRFGIGLFNMVPFLNLLLFLIGLASVVMLFVDENNQTVWDKIAGTKTIKV